MTDKWLNDLYSDAWKDMSNAHIEKLIEEFKHLCAGLNTRDSTIDDHYVSNDKEDL
jgi:hypothetical protein